MYTRAYPEKGSYGVIFNSKLWNTTENAVTVQRFCAIQTSVNDLTDHLIKKFTRFSVLMVY